MREVSVSTNEQINQYYRTAIGPQKIYGEFFSSLQDITSFREQMAKNKAIVIGDALIHVLARDDASPDTLEVCLPASQVMSMGERIVKLGATFTPLPAMKYNGKVVSTPQLPEFREAVFAEYRKIFPNISDLAERYDVNCIAGLFVFKTEKTKKEIHLIATSSAPIEVPLGAYSTLAMNIATAYQVISLYPATSFIDKRALYLMDDTPTIQSLKRGFEQGGWTSAGALSGEEVLHPEHKLSIKTRWFGDSHCWIIDHPELQLDFNDGDPYLWLQTCSWYLCCPSADTVRLVRNRMENENFKNAHVVTWETEKAVWSHPCFWFLEGELLFRQIAEAARNAQKEEEVTATDSSEILDVGRPRRGSTSSIETERSSEVESALSDLAEWKYVRERANCTHRSVKSVDDLELAVVEFMKGLYKKVNENHQKNHNLKMIRSDIIRIRKLYSSLSSAIQQPTGYAVCIVLQCIEDVRNTGLCDTVQFQLEFSLSPPNTKLHMTCSIIIPADKVTAVQSELADITTWDQEEFKRAGVSVRLATLPDRD
ncbi:hypothetical protein VNI00_017675 [Paramarasmius palmivorus]|uniref:Uncharacterized protein n=1 Tax=Paramarasmius palmivorus TaxID=297713 RepID=A0AAW0B3U5_9AGAR